MRGFSIREHMVIYSLLQILSEAGGPGNERLRAGGRELRAGS